jgi:serine/threonine protein phosphatase PrpC
MIRVPYAHLHTAAATHAGMGGRQNEDRFAVSSYKLGADDDTASVFAIVSDGIGGHRAGEIAAEMAVETVSHMVAQSDGRDPLNTLNYAIQVTSDAIATQAKDDSQRLGMGTTCACAWVVGSRLYIASVGDSRVYLLRNGSLMQLTTDHTWVQEAVEKGILAPQDASKHPNGHVIRRYLGSSKTPKADVRLRLAKDETDTQARSNQGLRLLPGDVLLICTDGLTDMVPDEEIESAVRSLELQLAVQKLVTLACERSGKDNITVVMMLVPWGAVPEPRSSRFWKWVLIALVGLLLVALLVALASWVAFTFILPPSSTPTPTI